MSGINIRLLTDDDTLEFKNLRLESLRIDPDSWLSSTEEEETLSDFNFTIKIRSALNDGIFGYYGYFDNDRLLAYAQLASNYWNKKRHIVNLYDICVSEKNRRKGVGSNLIKFIISKIKNSRPEIEQVHLKVNSRNTGATRFYEKLGFTKVATINNGVKEKDGSYQDEFVYVLNLVTAKE